MAKLNKKFVEGIVPDPQKLLTVWDSELRGFGVAVLPSGRKTYCVQYRNQSRILKRFKIGVHGQITTEEARHLARQALGSVAHGDDPAEKRKDTRNLFTVNDLTRNYIERHGPKKRPKSLKEDQLLLKNFIIPAMGLIKVKLVTRRDIETLHLKLGKTPYQANRVLALLSKMFSLAVSWEWREDNPVLGIQKYQEHKRDRWLNDEELERLWAALDAQSVNITSYVFKLLLLTGARKGEVLQATWDQFELEKGIWIKPSHLTKQKKQEHLPLSDQAVEVLKEIKKHSGSSIYLFPGRVEGKPLQEIKTFWNTALKKAELQNVRIHDLRHTHASHLVSSGLSLSIVGKLLGHTQASTTQRYAHLADTPLREAANLFGSKVGQLEKKNRGTVVEIIEECF